MYIFDGILILTTLVSTIFYMSKDKIDKKYIAYAILFNLLVIVIHSFIGYIKWQIIPIYVLGFLLVLLGNVKLSKKLLRILFISFYTFILIASMALLYVFPMSDIPNPSGQYIIGTRDFIIEDQDRLELYTEDSLDTREFAFRMWYPTDSTSQQVVSKWIGNLSVSRGLAGSIGLPSFILDQISQINSNSYVNAPLSLQEDSYPVVIISHGWGGFMSLHTDLAEELSSRGYVVVSIDHTYGSVATNLGDRIAIQNQDALPDRSEANFLSAANQLVYTYAGDISKTLDYLESENDITSDAFFKGKLDLDHIGLIGHSTGGGADVAVALNDDRITALLGLDAWVEPISSEEIEKGLSIPAIFLRSETWEEGLNNANLYDLILNSDQAELYQIDGTTHSDFSMAYMFSPLMSMIGYTGSLNSDYLLQMQKDVMNVFFDQHLKGIIDQNIDLSLYEELKNIELS
ncbi:MAG: hypothetical protein C4537_01115 [Acholeplasma sp.]|nr:MAG: hypothetical protein C4537_01115 [Acholeplasma sp.]